MAQTTALTGLVAAPDAKGRLRLAFADRLEARSGRADESWRRLRRLEGEGLCTAWRWFRPECEPDDAGLRGECWVTLPGGKGAAAAARRERIRTLAAELRHKEALLTVRAKRYSFQGRRGERVSGVQLLFVGLEPLRESGPPRT